MTIPLDRYPRDISLRDGARITLRPMTREDVDRLWAFFREIPSIDKIFFREDVDRREVVERWAEQLDYDVILPILALHGDRVVGDATLHRNGSGWKQRVGTVRIQIAPDFRHRGLGTAMIREIRHVGEKAALNYLLAEVIEEQQGAIGAFEKMGFERAVVHRNFVNDQKGMLHNLVVLLYPMSVSDEEAFF
ncbi:MAG: GNAT family N-acetyltransferase [Deltaproteobacteria bacterium]|nr:GNAT family N-acetyltransferase [Deltaproteobacteria bacterium]